MTDADRAAPAAATAEKGTISPERLDEIERRVKDERWKYPSILVPMEEVLTLVRLARAATPVVGVPPEYAAWRDAVRDHEGAAVTLAGHASTYHWNLQQA